MERRGVRQGFLETLSSTSKLSWRRSSQTQKPSYKALHSYGTNEFTDTLIVVTWCSKTFDLFYTSFLCIIFNNLYIIFNTWLKPKHKFPVIGTWSPDMRPIFCGKLIVAPPLAEIGCPVHPPLGWLSGPRRPLVTWWFLFFLPGWRVSKEEKLKNREKILLRRAGMAGPGKVGIGLMAQEGRLTIRRARRRLWCVFCC